MVTTLASTGVSPEAATMLTAGAGSATAGCGTFAGAGGVEEAEPPLDEIGPRAPPPAVASVDDFAVGGLRAADFVAAVGVALSLAMYSFYRLLLEAIG